MSVIFAILIFLLYWYKGDNEDISGLSLGLFEAFTFLFGAFCSGFAGYAGMWVSIRANSRVASAARRCYNQSIQIAFRGGYFAAVINIALAIFGISFLFISLYTYYYFTTNNASK